MHINLYDNDKKKNQLSLQILLQDTEGKCYIRLQNTVVYCSTKHKDTDILYVKSFNDGRGSGISKLLYLCNIQS